MYRNDSRAGRQSKYSETRIGRVNNHFEENFTESSANISDSNLFSDSRNHGQGNTSNEEGEAIRLLSVKPNGKVEVND
jgi:hypothetical protein